MSPVLCDVLARSSPSPSILRPGSPPEILLTLPVQDLEISIGALYPAALSF
jgi:hypothetical protein